jgi:uncharacterized protein YbjT (DUF2867 family)
MYAITGATGNTGRVVAERLLAAGKQVRVIVRDKAKASALAKLGAEVVVAELSDQAALEKAFAGAEGVYLLSPPDVRSNAFIAERKALTQQLADTLARAKPQHVVLLSSIAAQHDSGTGPIVTVYNAEHQLRATGLNVTFLRAAYFVENWAAVIPVAKQDGVLPAFFPLDKAIPMVATHDIGVAAANALLDGPRGTRIIELAGPTDVRAIDVAASLSELLGREVKAVPAPLEAVVPTFTGAGMSEDMAQLFHGLYTSISSGKLAWQGTHESQRGSTSITDALRTLI